MNLGLSVCVNVRLRACESVFVSLHDKFYHFECISCHKKYNSIDLYELTAW